MDQIEKKSMNEKGTYRFQIKKMEGKARWKGNERDHVEIENGREGRRPESIKLFIGCVIHFGCFIKCYSILIDTRLSTVPCIRKCNTNSDKKKFASIVTTGRYS